MRYRSLWIVLISMLLLVSCTTSTDSIESTTIVSAQPVVEEHIVVPAPMPEESVPLGITWETTAETWRGMYGHRETVSLPQGGYARPYNGTGIFTLDSSIGSAAVSMGLVTYEEGGEVTIEIQEGLEYTKADSYEGWNTVFVFIGDDGLPIEEDLEGVLVIGEPIDDTEWLATAETPTHFTVHNDTMNIMTYLDIFTNDMLAVDEFGTNLLAGKPLLPSETVDIQFADHKELEEAILYRYGQMFHVQAQDAMMYAYYREWYPDFDSLDLILSASDRYEPIVKGLEQQTLNVENQCGYEIVELYLLTPEMEENLDFSREILQGESLYDYSTIDIRLDDLPYLEEFLSSSDTRSLLVVAYDLDNYMLVREWFPLRDPWTIVFTEDDFFE